MLTLELISAVIYISEGGKNAIFGSICHVFGKGGHFMAVKRTLASRLATQIKASNSKLYSEKTMEEIANHLLSEDFEWHFFFNELP